MDLLKGLDLFSGVGGITFALREFIEPVAYCEIDPYCQSVLLSRMQTGDLPKAPIWDDIRTLSFEELPPIDIICGGFPCQDISVAGTGKGLAGERSGLFFQIARLAEEIKPMFLFLENVPCITSRGGLQVVKEIAEMGYDCRWCVISAASVGALHKRERWFLLAHSKSERSQAARQPIRSQKKQSELNHKIKYDLWEEEPKDKFAMAGMVDGLSIRSHSIRALGNAVVPAQAKKAFQILMGLNVHV